MHTPPARFGPVVLAALVFAGLLGPSARADTPPQIDRVRIGLPAGRSGQDAGRSRSGAWAPVAVTLKAGSEGNPRDVFRLRIETNDIVELAYQYTVSVPAMAANSERTVQGYGVPGGDGAPFRVQLERISGQVVQTMKVSRDPMRDEVLGAADILFFAVGAGLSQLKQAAKQLDKPAEKGAEAAKELDKPAEKEAEPDPEAGQRKFVFAEETTFLPDRWFGYDAVDVVVLATGKREFVNQLAQDSESIRRGAMLEWVRRGGQLVLSVGRNKQEVAQLLKKMALLDCQVAGSEVVKSLPTLSTQWCNREGHRPMLQQVETAILKPGKGVHVMIRDGEKQRPIMVESACGLGRVILVAFDLDAPPFTAWDGQVAFWTQLQAEVAAYLPARQGKKPGGPMAVPPMRPGGRPMPPGMGEEAAQYDARGKLKRGLEDFEAIPVISFGVVAVFILFYIALVGPLDYFVLKKLFKRLELTWVTFPTTVILVSVAAYATAYSLKGDEVRINKIDLVDVDLHQPRLVYGQTWFTLFSPRVQSYTIGIEPSVGTWTAPVPAGAPGPVVTLLEGGDRTPRTGSQALFPRPYRYADEAKGLLEVPVPVWATRSFTASWRAPVRAKAPPIGIDDEAGPIRKSRDGQGLVGRLTNNLPVDLLSAALFYQDKWYSLGDLAPGESRRVELLFARDAQGQNRPLGEWFTNPQILAPGRPIAPSGRPISSSFQDRKTQNARSAYPLVKAMMFYRAYCAATDSDISSNAGLRSLDQTWRLRSLPEYPIPERPRYRDEAILVARTAMLIDKAETVAENGASASRLWLGAIPDGEQARPAIPGYITQETYLRVFIPVGSR